MTAARTVTPRRAAGRRRPRGYADWNPRPATRAVLDATDDVLAEYREHLPMTARQVFYALVGRGVIDKTEQSYGRLLDYLGRARRAGYGPDVPLVVLHVGDLDPSGESIFTALIEDAAAFAREDCWQQGQGVVGERVALTEAQAAEHGLPTAPPKRTDSRSARWDGTGTCQLEALPPDVLARTVETAIRRRLDLDQFAAVVAEEKAERDSLLDLDPRRARP